MVRKLLAALFTLALLGGAWGCSGDPAKDKQPRGTSDTTTQTGKPEDKKSP